MRFSHLLHSKIIKLKHKLLMFETYPEMLIFVDVDKALKHFGCVTYCFVEDFLC